MPKYRYGSGSVYRKRGWCYIAYYLRGARVIEAAHTKDEAEARRQLRARLGQIAEGRYFGPAAERVRVADLLDALLIDYQVNHKPSRRTLAVLVRKHLRPFFGNRAAHAVTTADVEVYQLRRQEAGARNATINRELAALKRAYALGRRAESIFKQPYIARLREDNARQGFFERWEYDAVLARLPDALRAPLTFAYYTGWRVHSEILPLTWDHVDLDDGTVRLYQGETKNQDGRVLALPQVLRAVLEQQWTEHLADYPGCPWVFHRDGRRIKDFRKAWRRACQAAGRGGKIPHDFRRTAVRNFVRAGVPERVAMMITGHKTRTVFERYNIVSPGDLQEAARRIDRAEAAADETSLRERGSDYAFFQGTRS
jgi:integrase